jgi:hypothetical protein
MTATASVTPADNPARKMALEVMARGVGEPLLVILEGGEADGHLGDDAC